MENYRHFGLGNMQAGRNASVNDPQLQQPIDLRARLFSAMQQTIAALIENPLALVASDSETLR